MDALSMRITQANRRKLGVAIKQGTAFERSMREAFSVRIQIICVQYRIQLVAAFSPEPEVSRNLLSLARVRWY